jgi:hypothetical protein
MKYSCRVLWGSVILAAFSLPASAQQKLTFDNVTPPIVVDLLTGQNLVIQTNGNVNAKCVIDTLTNRCVGLGATSSGTAPTVSLNASGFSSTIDVNGKYDPGTTFTITPTVSPNAEVCIRQGASSTGWSGAVTAPFTSGTFTLPASETTYTFQLKCFSDGGSALAPTAITLRTNTISNGQCTIIPPAVNGYTRASSPTSFTNLISIQNTQCSNFPNTGTPLCKLLTPTNAYVSIGFTAPLASNFNYAGATKEFLWEQLQSNNPADERHIYVTLSQCPGDFRIPLTAAGPPNDPTLSIYCRNFRAVTFPGGIQDFSTSINYNTTGVSGGGTCGIVPGQTYYFNFILADPVDGLISPGEGPTGCVNSSDTVCGLQMRVH